MTTDLNGSGGANDGSGGAGENKPNNSNDGKDTVAFETHQKLLKEKKALADKLAAFEADSKKREEAEALEKQEFKKLYESEKAKAQELEGKYNALNANVTDTRKLHAFMKKVGGEIREDYWGLIDLTQIAMDPESGKIDDGSVARYAKEFEKKHEILIQRPNGGKLPNGAPLGGSTTLTHAEWLKLPLKEQLARMKDVDQSTL